MTRITLDDVARQPRPGLTMPGGFAFAPDGRTLCFLHSEAGGLSRALYALDLESGERRVLFPPPDRPLDDGPVSHEEALRRERQRLMHTGVTGFQWASKAPVLLVPFSGELWVMEGFGEPRRVGGDGGIDPHLSPDGSAVAYVRDGELHVADVASGEERRLTFDAEPGLTNGLAEYVAQEEIGRSSGFWWSPDGSMLAYAQADERHIPVYPIPHWGAEELFVEEHRYPFTGAENARVRLGVVSASGGDTRWLDLGDACEYVARVNWHPDGRLLVQTQTRDQRRLELRAYDVSTGACDVLIVEESPWWVNVHSDMRVVEPTGEIVWASERDGGLKQLSLYAPDGTLVRRITDTGWPIDGTVSLDAERRLLVFAGSPSPVELHLWRVSLDGGEPERLTDEPGLHGAVFAPGSADTYVHTFQSRTQPPRVSVVRPGAERLVVHEPSLDVSYPAPELHSFENREGVTLQALVYKPERLPAPLIVRVYGGPHAQTVQDSWVNTVDLSAQYLAQEGFLVVAVDNRGSARRGLEFEAALWGRMGSVEVADQVDGVRWAQSHGWVDGDRVGVYGWSYGGYMTLMCMLRAPEVFRVGVAGAPVTFWEGYDTHYTERYMRHPDENPDGYREAAAMTHAEALAGRLMIVHGMIDENVHFRHTARFLDALAAANKPCELLVYPNERHSPRSEAGRRNMQDRIVSFFRAHL